MSFDVWLTCFQNGEPATFPRALAERAFVSITDQSDPKCWILEGGSTLYIDNRAEVYGFAVNKPPLYDEFWEAVMEILRRTPSVFYWPGGGSVIADPAVAEHVPDIILSTFGTPTVTNVPTEILDLIENS